MKVSVVGTGYVGLVAGVCFADAGHQVVCVDRDETKIKMLKNGEIPIYEPGLEDILHPAMKSGRIEFTTDLRSAVQSTDVIFIAVGTPEKADGSADLGPTFTVATQIAEAADAQKIVVLKSTVPVGTAHEVQSLINAKSKFQLEVINNPEFLKEGSAIDDFLKPDRVVIGCKTAHARNVMSELYAPFVKNGNPIIFMDNASAELTKYAANAFLSVKISFINELARLADKVGADIDAVRAGFTSDGRINPAFFYPGLGYGGSCFPKDVKALINTAAKNSCHMDIVQAADDVNDRQKTIVVDFVKAHFGNDLRGKRFAIWGLSFKPRTDDVREAPAQYVIAELQKLGASITTFDPVATENAKKLFGLDFEVAPSAYAALEGADGLIICTEWNEFRSPDFAKMKRQLKSAVIFDGRNVYDPKKVRAEGFEYFCVGRQAVGKSIL